MPSKPRPLNDPKEGDKAKIVDFLLDIADKGQTADIYQLARENEISNPDKVLEDFAGVVGANRIHYPDRFPDEVLRYYNAGLAPTGDLLQADDIQDLAWLADRYAERLINKNAPQQSYSTMSGNSPPPYQPSYNPPPNPYPSYSSPMPNPNEIQLPPPSEESAAESQLLEYILTSTYNPRPHLIGRFLEMFRRFHQYWISHPDQLFILMKQNFGEQAGAFAYSQWANMRNIVVPGLGGNPMATMANPMGMGMPNMNMQNPMMGMPGYQQPKSAEDERWERMDKMMSRHMQMKYMEMMTGQTNNNQTPPPPPGTAYAIRDVVDAHGRPTGQKEYIPTPIGAQTQQAESKLAEVMLQSMAQERNILLQKLEQPNSWLEKLATTALSNHAQTVNPFEGFKQILELNNQLNQNKPQQETKSLEALSKEIDAKLAIHQMTVQERKEQREFEREITAEKTASENAREYVEAIKDVVKQGIQPFLGQFAAGLAGQQQQQVQAQQAQVTAQQQENMMMQQQQMEAERVRQQALQEAQIRHQQTMAHKQMMMEQSQQQQQAHIPIDEQLANLSDGQLEQAFAELDQGLRQNERVYKKVSAERAKRRMMRGGGIGARVQQQQMYAPAPPSPPPQEQSFEERVRAGQQQQQAQEEEEPQAGAAAASESMEDTTKSTMGAVTTELRPDDRQAMEAGKDGIAAQPMDFGVGGVPRQEEVQADTDNEEPPLEEEEEYEEEEES